MVGASSSPAIDGSGFRGFRGSKQEVKTERSIALLQSRFAMSKLCHQNGFSLRINKGAQETLALFGRCALVLHDVLFWQADCFRNSANIAHSSAGNTPSLADHQRESSIVQSLIKPCHHMH